MKAARLDWRYRLAVTSRAMAGAFGGYALAAAATAALTLALLPFMTRVEAVLTATLLSWLVYACAVAWAFYARTVWGAWGAIGLPALALGALAMAPRWLGGA
ncbi:DUF3649 domain-containing protein [Acidovorax sp. SUPP2522]|uniref:DUF3649 domain-containing protein n=1 Tax=unclassified Acidovorax TaxID=2684926 RepID=UPI002349B8B2|nr:MULTISPECIES: DUF3649 domain-containing protein [unclassified Acidovorax]WCM99173.1 DUF3649 domain-containing protein [Acidovorax sp. GBBC 1281]GKT15881.1 DUF3649 domain-containing protein [Acidovorax sp. SUPP2522]